MKEIKIKLRNLRKEKNLSQEKLAEELGVSRQAIIALEQGESLPSLPLFCQMVEFFQTPFDYFFDIPEFNMVKINNNKKGGSMRKDLGPFSPMREVSSLHEMIDRIFEEQLTPFSKSDAIIPSINIHETENELVIEAHLAGIEEKDLNVEVEDDMVTISGERKEEEVEKEKNYFRKEINYGSFVRQIPIGIHFKTDEAEANLKDGVLKIILPKTEPTKPKVKKIAVKKR